MFARLPETPAAPLAITIDGVPFVARAGDTVAVALLVAGNAIFRTTPISGAPRGPYCMMGACFECLVGIDGRANQQACMIEVAQGMRVNTQRGAMPPDAQR
jgi:predicted molibdopterin-dependent oxidoreductase YjgC